MAAKYVYSGAAGAANGTSWTDAYTSVATALAAIAAGDTLYVADDHAESQGSNLTWTPPGTFAAPNYVLCCRRTGGSVPPVSADLRTTATVTTTGAFTMSFGAGCAYVYGVTFQCGSGSNGNTINLGTVTGNFWQYESCTFKMVATGAGARIIIGSSASNIITGRILFKNCALVFANASQSISLNGQMLEMVGGSIALTGTVPTTLFNSSDTHPTFTYLRDVDLSGLGSGKTLYGAFVFPQRFVFERCKLGASVTVAAAQAAPGVRIDLIDCDSGATQYRNESYQYGGVLTTETVVVMASGSTDGVQAASHKIVNNANAGWLNPFESFPMGEFYSDTLNISVSQTFELMTDNVVLTNRDAWVELEYMGSSATPLGSVATSGVDALGAGSNLTTSAASWTTTGIGTPKPQKIVVSFTPQLKGRYRAVLKVSKASATVWLNRPATKAA
jgi:hypothetical protein